MTKKHAAELSLQFMAVFLAGFTLLGFWFFITGLESLNRFNVVAGGTLIFLGGLALYYYSEVAKKLR